MTRSANPATAPIAKAMKAEMVDADLKNIIPGRKGKMKAVKSGGTAGAGNFVVYMRSLK